MKNVFNLSLVFLLFCCTHLFAQTEVNAAKIDSLQVADITTKKDTVAAEILLLKPKNHAVFIKTTLTGIPFKNYTFQIEKTLSKTISLALAYRIMPIGSIPFKSKIIDEVGTDDPDTRETIENIKIGNYAITPEIRFYLSKKGYGKGFYIAPFYRYAQYEITNMLFKYKDEFNADQSMNLSGKVTGNTAGVLLGTQWFIGKNLSIDWWILGAHYGSASGSFDGKSSRPLDSIEQNELRQQLNDIDIPLTDTTVEVTANGASLKIDGPWAGLRTGLSVGFRF